MNVAHTAELDMNSSVPDSMSGNEGAEDQSEINDGVARGRQGFAWSAVSIYT